MMADESTMTTSNQTSLRVWLRMLTCTRMIENQIRGQLRENFDTTLPRFDVMAQLYRYRDGLRMGELSQLLMVTGGNITGIIDQLVREDLVQRLVDRKDRRAYIVKLTDKGIEEFEKMADVHHGWVDNMMDGLSAEEQSELHSLLKTLRHSLEEKQLKND